MIDLDPLLARAREKKYVLLGEATHGTHEFYELRAELTRRLIETGAIGAVAAEADWPDAYRVNRYVRGASDDATADEALADFRRFPTWMWRNVVVREFVEWLREWNAARPERERVGFYGIDLYSLHASIEAVLAYLDRVAPNAAARARERYGCFDHARDPAEYAEAAAFGAGETCEDEAVAQVVELRELASRDGRLPRDEQFFAEQNARLVKNAEEYYRTMFRGRVSSWNLRDSHMVETLVALRDHLGVGVAVWAHNSHLGDARATELGAAGEHNVGQLVRERCGDDAFLLGFTTYSGTVTAARGWGGEAERRNVRPALAGSWEEQLHDRGNAVLLELPEGERLERAIGVVYAPQTERLSHYFGARLAEQFDAVVHVDETHALEPLERTQEWETGEAPETYPTGL